MLVILRASTATLHHEREIYGNAHLWGIFSQTLQRQMGHGEFNRRETAALSLLHTRTDSGIAQRNKA